MRWKPEEPSIYLPNSGQIDLNAIGVEAGQANNSQTALNDAAVRDMIGKGANAQNAMSEYYGAYPSDDVDLAGRSITYSESQLSPYGYGGYNIDNGFSDFYVSSSKGGDLHNLYMFTDETISAGKGYTISYDLTFLRPASGSSVEIYFSLVPNADPLFESSYPQGYGWRAEDSQKIITGIPGQSQWQKYDGNAWVNFSATRMRDRAIKASRANLRVSGSFNHTTGSSGPYQMGIACKSKVGETNSGLIHLCVNRFGAR